MVFLLRPLVSLIFISAFLLLATPAFGQDYADLNTIETVFESAITWVARIGGFLAFLAIIFGGFKYIMARGDPKAIASAQSTLTWAFIGLAFIIFAWLILVFIEDFTGVEVTIFRIRNPFP